MFNSILQSFRSVRQPVSSQVEMSRDETKAKKKAEGSSVSLCVGKLGITVGQSIVQSITISDIKIG